MHNTFKPAGHLLSVEKLELSSSCGLGLRGFRVWCSAFWVDLSSASAPRTLNIGALMIRTGFWVPVRGSYKGCIRILSLSRG